MSEQIGPRRAFAQALALACAVLLCAAGAARPARANGVPVRIPLTYLSGLSNWGPADAKGGAELSFAEGAVRLEAHGLPQLNGEQYQLWLVKSATNKASSLGAFSVDASGATSYTGKMNNLDGYDYDLLQITVQSLANADPAPSARRSIGGFFTPLKRTDGTGGEIAGDTQPATLPNTGDTLAAHPRSTPKSSHQTLGLILIAGGALLAITAVRRRRPSA